MFRDFYIYEIKLQIKFIKKFIKNGLIGSFKNVTFKF